MKQDIKDRWVQALRSGEYMQGAGHLRVTHKGVTRYCCLGVLCDLAAQDGVIDAPEQRGYFWWYDREATSLPGSVAEWAGLDPYKNLGPFVYIDGLKGTLATHNDNGFTFEQIAEAIEREA